MNDQSKRRGTWLAEDERVVKEPTTGEWTNVHVEELWEKGGSITVKDAHNAALAAVCKVSQDSQKALWEATKQLAAEREALRWEKKEHEKAWEQLAAEREKSVIRGQRADDAERRVQTLVDALTKIATPQTRSITAWNIAEDALEKVK